MSADQAVQIFRWIDARLVGRPGYNGLSAEPRAVFGTDNAATDLDGDGAYSRAELVSAVPRLYGKADLRRRALRAPLRPLATRLRSRNAVCGGGGSWYNVVVAHLVELGPGGP